MKKLVLVSVAMLLFSATSFAKGGGGEEASVVNYSFDIRVSQLSNYLQLTSAQTREVSDICDFFTEKMREASYSSKKNQKSRIDNAVYGNLKLMKETLNEEQYKKYLKVLNVTLRNRGIDL